MLFHGKRIADFILIILLTHPVEVVVVDALGSVVSNANVVVAVVSAAVSAFVVVDVATDTINGPTLSPETLL